MDNIGKTGQINIINSKHQDFLVSQYNMGKNKNKNKNKQQTNDDGNPEERVAENLEIVQEKDEGFTGGNRQA